jgi:outer membrane protein assembly factor BamD (BamD/ComL family)
MPAPLRLTLALAAAALALPAPSPAGILPFGPRKGSPFIDDSAAAQRLLDQGLAAAARGDADKALAKFESLRRQCARTPQAGVANYEIGCLHERSNQLVAAWQAWQLVVEEYPDSGRFAAAVANQLRVSSLLFSTLERVERGLAEKRDLQRLTREEIMGMMQTALRNARTADGTPESAYRLAGFLQKYGRPAEARDELLTLAAHHPQHHLADDAAFQAAIIDFKGSTRRNSTDADRERAIDSLKDFITVFPDSEKVPEATHRLALCRHSMFRSLLDQAVSWENRGKPAAAAICYQILGTRYADLASANPELAARIAAATPPTPPSKPSAAPASPTRPRTPANPLDPVLR